MSNHCRCMPGIDCGCGGYSPPRSISGTTKGVIKLDHATVHVTLRPDVKDGVSGFLATALVEMHCKEFGDSKPMKFRASTPKEAWAAMSSEVYKQLTRFN